VRATGDIGPFLITSEGGVAAGVRRIEAITGLGALATVTRYRDEAAEIGATVGASTGQLAERVAALHEENKRLARELQQTKVKLALDGGAAGGDEAVEVAGVKLVARQVDGVDKDALRALVDQHRDRIKSGVVVLASPVDGKVLIVVGVTADLVKTVPAGQVVKRLAPIVGGGGGGRADFAEAGGKDPQKIAEMLAASREVVAGLLSGTRA